MTERSFPFGDLVVLTGGEWKGTAGIVSWPITGNDAGYVLVYSDGRIAGLKVSGNQIKPADESIQGCTQLAYHLLKLSSLMIEKGVLQNIFPAPKTPV
jgi:hypothetical protein